MEATEAAGHPSSVVEPTRGRCHTSNTYIEVSRTSCVRGYSSASRSVRPSTIPSWQQWAASDIRHPHPPTPGCQQASSLLVVLLLETYATSAVSAESGSSKVRVVCMRARELYVAHTALTVCLASLAASYCHALGLNATCIMDGGLPCWPVNGRRQVV